jgi:hypothetical protein
MKYEFEIFTNGLTYTSALKLIVCEEDRHDLERVLFENGCEVRIRPVNEDENEE